MYLMLERKANKTHFNNILHGAINEIQIKEIIKQPIFQKIKNVCSGKIPQKNPTIVKEFLLYSET